MLQTVCYNIHTINNGENYESIKTNCRRKKWIEITMQEAIDLCEGAGYWKEGTVEGILMEGHTIRTPWSFFKIKTNLKN